MDEIKASPVTNPYAFAMSKALRAARDLGNKVNVPVLGPAGDMLLGKSPEEVENWGYGNSPIAMPPSGTGGYIPIVKTGRKEGLFDAMGMLPLGGGGAIQEAGTLPFKLRRKSRLVSDWVENGLVPYTDAAPDTIKEMNRLTQKADKLSAPESLWRMAHDPDEVAALSKLKPGDLYEPSRITSTARRQDDGMLEEIADTFPDNRKFIMNIDAPAGTRIGGDLGGGSADYYNEFVLRKGAPLQYLGKEPYDGSEMLDGADLNKFKALTDSEANMLRRKVELLRSKK